MTDDSQTGYQQKIVFLRLQDLRMTAVSCPSRDLIDCNMGVQASHAQPHTARPLSRQHQKCGHLYWAHSPTADEATVSLLNHRSRVSLTVFLWDKIFSRQDFRSMITGPASTPIAPQGSKWALFRTASAAVTALLHPRATDFLENPARATQVFQGAGAGRAQSDAAPDNAATLHGAHGWARTRFTCTNDSKSGLACSQHLTPLSQRTSQAPLPRTLSSYCMSFLTELSGAPD